MFGPLSRKDIDSPGRRVVQGLWKQTKGGPQKLPHAQMEVVRKEVKDLVTKGAVRRVPVAEAKAHRGFYSSIFCVPKPGGKWRAVIDL